MSSGKDYARLSEVFALGPVIPVITIEDAAAAVPLAPGARCRRIACR